MNSLTLPLSPPTNLHHFIHEMLAGSDYDVQEISSNVIAISDKKLPALVICIFRASSELTENKKQISKLQTQLNNQKLTTITVAIASEQDALDAAVEAGADDFIQYPLTKALLRKRIEQLGQRSFIEKDSYQFKTSTEELKKELLESKKIQDRLRYYQSIVRLSNDLMALVDRDFNYKVISKKYCDLFDKEEQDIIDHSVATLHGTESFETVIKPLLVRTFSGEELQIKHEIFTKKYGARWVDAYQAPIYKNGFVIGAIIIARDITEQLRADDKIRQYTHIVSAISESIAFLDENMVFAFANQAYLNLFQLTHDDLIGKHFIEVRGEDLFNTVESKLRRCLQGENIHWQTWAETAKGRTYLDIVYNPYRDSDNDIVGIVISIRDRTSLKQADESLRKYEQIVGASSDLMSFIDRDYVYQAVNQKYLKTYKKTREQIVGHTVAELLGDKVFARIKTHFDQCMAGTPILAHETMMWEGERHEMELRIDPYRNSAGFVTGAVINVRNITDRFNAANALRALAQATMLNGDAEFLSDCLKSLTETYNVDYAFIAIYSNKEKHRMRTLSFYKQGIPLHNFEYPLKGSPCEDCLQQTGTLISNQLLISYPEFHLLNEFPVESYFGIPLKSVNGETIGVVSVMDSKPIVTNQWTQPILGIFATRIAHELHHKWAEEDQRRLLTIHKATLESTADAVAVIGEYEKLVSYNQKFIDMWNVPQDIVDDLDGVRCSEHILNQLKEPELLLQEIDAYFLNRESSKVSVLECIDGRLIERFSRPYFIDGKVMGRAVSFRDITESRRSHAKLEIYRDHLEELVKARTIELELAVKEIESFSYSVSHDLRSPLRAIDGYSRILMEDYANDLDDTAINYLKRSRAASQRMGALIDDLLVLSRLSRRKLRFTEIELDKMSESVHDQLCEREPNRDVQLRVEDNLRAYGDRQLIRIALENLIGNAWKYTSRLSHAEINIGVLQKNAETIYFIKDNGVGFDMEYASNIFKAFFRLHSDEEFEGTGIGLATTAKIIERHGGRIWAEGKVNQGATIYFTLPTKEPIQS